MNPIPDYERLRDYRYRYLQCKKYKRGRGDLNTFVTKGRCQTIRKNLKAKVGKCEDCGSIHNLTCEHIVPIRLGGSTRIWNIRILCNDCNQKNSVKTKDYIEKNYPRLLVPWHDMDWSPGGSGIKFLRGDDPSIVYWLSLKYVKFNNWIYRNIIKYLK